MSYSYDKNTRDIVVSGFDQGVGASPHKGLGSMQGVNLATESGEAMCSFGRVKQSQDSTIAGGTLTQVNTNTVSPSIDLKVGQVITITNAGTTGLKIPFTPISLVSVLVVAGGAGGGNGGNIASITSAGGGGGAGGVLPDPAHAVSVTSYPVTVGGGGSAVTNGSNSSFDTLTAIGGGHGGTAGIAGSNGGSGGGGGGDSTTLRAGGTGTALQGNAGGSNGTSANAGGGGGSVSAGNSPAGTGGVGGSGTVSSISGSSVTYGSGGGGGAGSTGSGGAGGAGAGTGGAPGGNGTSATANTGSGGGGSGGGVGFIGGSGAAGIVIISYPTQTSPAATGGTITTSGGNTIHTFTTSGTFTVLPSQTGNYYYLSTGKLYGGTTSTGSLPPNDPDAAAAVTGITAGTATFIITYPLGMPYQSATETYRDMNGIIQYRYYILDSFGNIWCHDTYTLVNWTTPLWFFVGNAGAGASGLAVYNGWLFVTNGTNTYWKLTVLLGNTFINTGGITSLYGVSPRVALNGHNGALFVSDGNTIASWFANTSLTSTFSNIQSYAQYTASMTTGTVIELIGGTNPSVGVAADRIPVTFFTNGTLPSAISATTIYYVVYVPGTPSSFTVFSAASGGSAIDIQTGSSGRQYFNTFDPHGIFENLLWNFSFQNLFLPFYEQVTSMAELGGQMVIGGIKNALYLWDEISVNYSNIILLPENNTQALVTANNTVYAFTGSKGNIYITNGSIASPVISVPDYCAGIPGTASSYIEPYFSWGGAAYARGRMYFSIQDQTAAKAGNCGGIWSFVPTQNLFVGQDVGIALRMENVSSYGTLNGSSPVILPSQSQNAIGPQFWSGWQSSISSPSYGIDFSDTVPQAAVIETDFIPTGTLLGKESFEQVEYKLGAPLLAGDSITMKYRKNNNDAWTSMGAVNEESLTELSGYWDANFEKTQWVQLQATLNPGSPSSFIRLREIRLR